MSTGEGSKNAVLSCSTTNGPDFCIETKLSCYRWLGTLPEELLGRYI